MDTTKLVGNCDCISHRETAHNSQTVAVDVVLGIGYCKSLDQT